MKSAHIFQAILFCLLLAISGNVFAGDKPGFDVDFYGCFKLDGSYDQNLTSNGNYVLWIQPQTQDRNDNQFNMTANQTRFGLKAEGKGYERVKVSGMLEFNLYGAVTGATVAENNAMLQLVHAFFKLGSKQFTLLAGQTSDLFSPLYPPMLNYPVLFGCGNVGYRRPQVSLFYNIPSGSKANVELAGGFFRTIGSDLTPTFSLATGEASEGADDGTDAAIPAFQSRVDFNQSFSGGSLQVGVSGLWGQLKAETSLGHSEEYESWGVNGYLQLKLTSGAGFMGEVYSGSNLGGYAGAIYSNNTVKGVDSKGGYGAAWVKPIPSLTLNAGGGLDNVDTDDIANNARNQNRCIFGNIQYSVVSNVVLGLEVSSWQTQYRNAPSADNVRVQSSFILNF